MPPGLTAEELKSQERMSVMGSSVVEGSEAGEIRPANEDGVEYINLTLSPHTGDPQVGDHPGPPWQLEGHARMSMDMQDQVGRWTPAKYVRCDVVNNEPIVYSTMGVDHLEFGEPLKASPFIGPLQCKPVKGGYTEFSNANYFECATTQGVELLGDYRVLAEVHHYQWCEAECQWLHVHQRVTKQKREEAEREERAIGWELRVLEVAKNEVEERLTKARVRGWVVSLFEEGEDLNETLGNNKRWLSSLLSSSRRNPSPPHLIPSPPSIHLAE